MAISEKTTTSRREEIVTACEKLYRTMSFREITLKEISEETSFSRPSIYNYFATKEEIFLALFEREYDRWNAELEEIHRGKHALSVRALAEKLAKSLAARPQLLKLLSMNLYDMEANSRLECLTRFKHSYGRALENMKRILLKFRPEMTGRQIRDFIYAFFPFMFGVYPYTEVTEKQKEAMEQAGIDFELSSARELIFIFIYNYLNNKQGGSDK
ncbi:MAG: TetR family transcriptional regulator [Victivallales bacterium]|nr:TetR family transcriptional regulator [Victivallales bacterium]